MRLRIEADVKTWLATLGLEEKNDEKEEEEENTEEEKT